jgi:hypothetical protein
MNLITAGTIEFRPTNTQNFRDIISLKVTPNQGDYIDSNLYSIAYFKICLTLATYGIYTKE